MSTSYDNLHVSTTSFSSVVDFYGIGKWVDDVTLPGCSQGAGIGTYCFISAVEDAQEGLCSFEEYCGEEEVANSLVYNSKQ